MAYSVCDYCDIPPGSYVVSYEYECQTEYIPVTGMPYRRLARHYPVLRCVICTPRAEDVAVRELRLEEAKADRDAAELRRFEASQAKRPCIQLSANLAERVDRDGAPYYVASYDGVESEPGDTPREAFQNFDRLWMEGREGVWESE